MERKKYLQSSNISMKKLKPPRLYSKCNRRLLYVTFLYICTFPSYRYYLEVYGDCDCEISNEQIAFSIFTTL